MTIALEIVHRFDHEVAVKKGVRCWDWQHIYSEVLLGVALAKQKSNPISIAFDSWAIDYGLLDQSGELLEPVVSYRDSRTELAYPLTVKGLGADSIYEATGIQFLPFNTLYQLVADQDSDNYRSASTLLLLPDLLNYLFTGIRSTEITNASTTQLLNPYTRNWDDTLIKRAGLRRELFTSLHEPGTVLGEIRGHGALDGLKVVATASHDTASAIAGTPLLFPHSQAYISSGTWSLVGVETLSPITTGAAREANLTNELGVESTVRLLKNVAGMWLLEECRRAWALKGEVYSVPQLLDLALDVNFSTIIDPNDPHFISPEGMPDRIRSWCSDRNLLPPSTPGEFTICILNSLALAYKETLETITKISEWELNSIHIIGGGSQIRLLNQLTANLCGVPVEAGPVEATLYGNIAVQVIAAGLLPDLKAARSIIANSFSGEIFRPVITY
jgi:rhamnulokinase